MPTTTCPESCLACWLLSRPDCDGTDTDVRTWLVGRGADPRSVLPYLQSEGGFCSCEVVANALTGGRMILDDLVLACGGDTILPRLGNMR